MNNMEQKQDKPLREWTLGEIKEYCIKRLNCSGCRFNTSGTCKWYDAYLGICCNGDSDWVADFRAPHRSCEEWEAINNE